MHDGGCGRDLEKEALALQQGLCVIRVLQDEDDVWTSGRTKDSGSSPHLLVLRPPTSTNDLTRFATKNDLTRFATTEDIEGFATTDDVKDATENDQIVDKLKNKTGTGMSGNPKRLKQTHVFNVPPPTHVTGVVAIVYSWTFNPPFDHALKGCSYFGQTKQVFEVRTRQHKNDSIRNPKELGLHALWRQYPYDDHWGIQIIETRSFINPVDAHAWMDGEEARLIEAHGSVLRNMENQLKQTLNLTRGGQGDPRKVWDAIMAKSRQRLSNVWPKLERWYEANKHLRIPVSDPDLGKVVNSIRSRKCFLQHSDFKAWLDERGFVYDEHRAHLEIDVWPKLERWYEANKHLRIPQSDPDLGNVVNNIRSRKQFLQHSDFAMWLWCACFKMHTMDSQLNRERWTQVFASTEVAVV